MNDVVCLFMAPLVLDVCKRMGVRPLPYLLALATASNIGGVATITGNPQNMLIGSVSGISYRHFLAHLGPVALDRAVHRLGGDSLDYTRGDLTVVANVAASFTRTRSLRASRLDFLCCGLSSSPWQC